MAVKANLKAPFRFNQAQRTAVERQYLEDLQNCADNSPLTTVEMLMNFPMYAPRQNVTNFLIKYEIFKRVLSVHGSVIECGVSYGAGLMGWAQFSAILEPTNHQRRVVGFDTFSGFPGMAKEDAHSASPEARTHGLAIDSHDHISRCAELYDMNRFVGHMPKVELVRGDATKTIPQFVKDNPQLIVSLLYLDFDVYEPTRMALEYFLPRMPKGAVIGFDELNLKDWPGESIAVLEKLKLGDLRIERFSFGSTISYAQIS